MDAEHIRRFSDLQEATGLVGSFFYHQPSFFCKSSQALLTVHSSPITCQALGARTSAPAHCFLNRGTQPAIDHEWPWARPASVSFRNALRARPAPHTFCRCPGP